MARKPQSKTELSDAERHRRFVDMAKEVNASEQPSDFERAFERVTRSKGSKTKPSRDIT